MIITNTAWDFSTSTGYEIVEENSGDVEITGGSAGLTTGAIRGAVRTPAIDTSSWSGAIQSIVGTFTQQVGNDFRFFATFNALASDDIVYEKFFPVLGWLPAVAKSNGPTVILQTLKDNGMTAKELSRIRDYPPRGTGTSLSVLCGFFRSSGGGYGRISQLTIRYGSETILLSPNATSAGELVIKPQSFRMSYFQPHVEFVTADNYVKTTEFDTGRRRSAELRWGALDNTQRTNLVNQLQLCRSNQYFLWTPQGTSTERKFQVVGDIEEQQAGIKDFWMVFCRVREYQEPS